jgi:hypothetical protein
MLKVLVGLGCVILFFWGVRSCQENEIENFNSTLKKRMGSFESSAPKAAYVREFEYIKSQIVQDYEASGSLPLFEGLVSLRQPKSPWVVSYSEGILKFVNKEACEWTAYVPTLRSSLNRSSKKKIFFYCFKNHEGGVPGRCRRSQDARLAIIGCASESETYEQDVTKALADQKKKGESAKETLDKKVSSEAVEGLILDISNQLSSYVREYSEEIDSEYSVSPSDPYSLIIGSGFKGGVLEYELKGCGLLRFSKKEKASGLGYGCSSYNLSFPRGSKICPSSAGGPGGFFIETSDCEE